MFRPIVTTLFLFMAFLAACERTPASGPPGPGEPFRAVVTVPALAGLVKPMLPQGAELRILMQPGRSEHGYEFTPTDIAALGRADLVVYIGLGLEPQVRTFIEKRPSESRRVVCFAEVLGLQKPGEAVKPHDHAHDHDHPESAEARHEEHAYVDPHLWLDPVLVEAFLPALRDQIGAALQARGRLDLGAKARLDEAAGSVQAVVAEVDREYRERLAPFAGRALVTHHAAFGRLAARYGLEIAEVLRPMESAEPTPGQIAQVVEAVKSRGVHAIFIEPQFDASAARRVAEAAGVRVGTLDPLGSGDWAGLMRANLDSLVSNLTPSTTGPADAK
ncbi:MAG: zinc ABC transporter substrate-binding protein [Phycisphaerales bacterium]|nr:zinc ABC transporter substrate-binding protein [Phycisphaerales bacterium]